MRGIIKNIQIGLCILTVSTNWINAQWVQTNGPYGGDVAAVAMSDSVIAVAMSGYHDAFLSKNNGLSWTPIYSTDPFSGITVLNQTVLININSRLFTWNETKNGWEPVNSGSSNLFFSSLVVQGNTIYAGTSSGVFLSTDMGKSWSSTSTDIFDAQITSLAVRGSTILSLSRSCDNNYCVQHLFLSKNNGSSWAEVNSTFLNGVGGASAIALTDSCLFVGTAWGRVFRSVDNGTTWEAIWSDLLTHSSINSLLVSGKNVLAATMGKGVILSSNNGTSWTEVNSGLENKYATRLSTNGTTIILGTSGGGVYRSGNNIVNWEKVSSGIIKTNIYSLFVKENIILAGTEYCVFQTTDNDTTWTASDLTKIQTQCYAYNGNVLFAGTSYGGIYRSVNNGINWTLVDSGFTDKNVTALAVYGNNIFAGTTDGDILRSTDNGNKWTTVNNLDEWVSSLVIKDNTIFAGTEGKGVFVSTNNGTNWINSGLTTWFVTSLAENGGTLFAGTGSGVFQSHNNGATWSPALKGNIYSLVARANKIFASTDGGFYQFDTNTTSWIVADSGLPKASEHWRIAVSDSNIFCGSIGTGVWRKSLSEKEVTTITKSKCAIKNQVNVKIYSPDQNHSTARVEFSLQKSDVVAVKIYNLNGQEIAILANKTFEPGIHNIKWNTENIAKGCYTFCLHSSETIYTKNIWVSR